MLLGVDQSLLLGLAEHLGEFAGGDRRVELVLGLDPHGPQRDVREPVVEGDQWPCQSDEDEMDGHQQHGGALRSGEGDVLRDHLAQHDVQHHDECQRDREGDRMQEGVGYVQQMERFLDQMRDGGFGDPAEQDRADGDAELCARQHQRQALACPDHRAGALLAVLLERLETVAARGDEREL